MSPERSYSRAWAKNACESSLSRWLPAASFSSTRIAASKSWPHSRPARSPESSDLRCHSSSAATIARSAQPPSGMNPNDEANRMRCISMVR